MINEKFYSDQSELCKLYGSGLIVKEYGDIIHVIFTDKDCDTHVGVYTKSKHIGNNT